MSLAVPQLPTGFAGLPTGFAGLPTGCAGLPTGCALLLVGCALLLPGCAGGAPAGHWSGELSCSDADMEGVESLDLDLARLDELHFSGPGSLSFQGQIEMSGAWRDFVSTLGFDTLELGLGQPRGAQTVTLAGSAVSCDSTVDGQVIQSSCDHGESADYELEWDGADTMTYDVGDCAGAFVRD